jgi:hypothetical protein
MARHVFCCDEPAAAFINRQRADSSFVDGSASLRLVVGRIVVYDLERGVRLDGLSVLRSSRVLGKAERAA